MSEHDSTKWKLDLDIAEFTEKALHAKGTIERIGDAKNLEGLVSGLTAVTGVLGIVGAAFFALKTTVETVFDAEAIKQVNTQFDNLAKSAGLAGEHLKDAMVGAAQGLIDDTDLLKSANKAIVEMGASASHLPEILKIAQAQTKIFGGDSLQTFEAINSAIASGQTRQLRSVGIMIDHEAATLKYAKSVGKVISELTDADKKQAVLNAVLEKGNKTIADGGVQVETATRGWKELKVTLSQIGEIAVLAYDKLMGPSVKKGISSLGAMASDAKKAFTDWFGDGKEQNEAHLDRVREKLMAAKAQLIDIEQGQLKRKGTLVGIAAFDEQYKIDQLTKSVSDYQKELGITAEKKAEFEKEASVQASSASPTVDPAVSDIATNKSRLVHAKLTEDIVKMQEQVLDSEVKNADSIAQVDEALAQKRLKIVELAEAEQAQVKAQFALGEIPEEIRDAKIIAIGSQTGERLKSIDDSVRSHRENALDNSVKQSENAADGMQRAFKAGAQKSKLWMSDFGAQGQMVFKTFSGHAVKSLEELGAGTKSASDVMKGFIFGMIGDTAEAYGEQLLLTSIWPPNPVGLAAGAGLLALSGYLKSQAGGSASAGIPSGGSGGGGASTSAASDTSTPQAVQQQQAQKKVVSIQIQGSYFETEQTRERLVSMIRDHADATDFNVKGINER